jgi:hypothetical protein
MCLDLMQHLDILFGVQDQTIYLLMNHLVKLMGYPEITYISIGLQKHLQMSLYM